MRRICLSIPLLLLQQQQPAFLLPSLRLFTSHFSNDSPVFPNSSHFYLAVALHQYRAIITPSFTLFLYFYLSFSLISKPSNPFIFLSHSHPITLKLSFYFILSLLFHTLSPLSSIALLPHRDPTRFAPQKIITPFRGLRMNAVLIRY